MNVQEWLDRQRSVPDGDADDGIEPAGFSYSDDPVLHSVIEEYLEARDVLAERAQELSELMRLRGWEPI